MGNSPEVGVGGQAPHIDMEAVPTLRAAFLQAWQVGASGGGRAVGSPAQSCSETEEGGGGGAGADVGAHLFLIPSEDRLTVTLREVLYFPRLTKKCQWWRGYSGKVALGPSGPGLAGTGLACPLAGPFLLSRWGRGLGWDPRVRVVRWVQWGLLPLCSAPARAECWSPRIMA